jgi:cytochrome oxidase Cu insertion factor (SCO1/SenC/PrrC family)
MSAHDTRALASVQAGSAAGLKVALISVDPERTPEQLGRYIASFGDLIGLTGVRPRL